MKRELVSDFFLFAFSLFSVIFFWEKNWIVFVLVITGWLIAILTWHEHEDFILYVVGGIGGPIGEIIAIHFGVWQYSNPDFFGIPIWLPFLWGSASVFIERMRHVINKIYKRCCLDNS